MKIMSNINTDYPLGPQRGNAKFRKPVPRQFMMAVSEEEASLIRSHIRALYGDNTTQSDSARVEYLGDCVLTDREEAVLKSLLIRITKRLITLVGRKSGIAEYWGEGNRCSLVVWVYMAFKEELQVPRKLRKPPAGHIRIDVNLHIERFVPAIAFDMGELYPLSGRKGGMSSG